MNKPWIPAHLTPRTGRAQLLGFLISTFLKDSNRGLKYKMLHKGKWPFHMRRSSLPQTGHHDREQWVSTLCYKIRRIILLWS
ncbi:MAG: hypothetical protein ACE5R6_15070 [Candidatus Heimdallarchaeota archaeon]